LIAEKLKPHGEVVTKDLKRFQGYEPTFIPYSMTKAQLQRLFFLSYMKFYTSFKYILKRLTKMKTKKGIRDNMCGALAMWSIFRNFLTSKVFRRTGAAEVAKNE